MEVILIIVGVILFIINIVMIVKFFQISNNLELLTKLFIDGTKPVFNPDRYERDDYAMTYYSKDGRPVSRAEWVEEKKQDLEDSKKEIKRVDFKEDTIRMGIK